MAGDARTVLVVEDDQDLLTLLAMILEDAGFVVLRAENGAAALEVVAERMPSLIVLDLKMPVMDGYEFAQHFRSRHGRSASILVLTAADDPKRRAAEIQAEGVLAKPFDYESLLREVERLA